MAPLHRAWLMVGCVLLGAATCSNKDAPKAAAQKPQQAAAAPVAPAAPPAAPSGSNLKDFPLADLSGLSDRQREAFASIANDEFCPCDCPMTLAACLQDEGKCPAAPLMAEVILRDLRSGMPTDVLKEQLAEAFSGGYSAPARTIVLDGYGSAGPLSAPVTIVEYSDFECPHCRDAAPVLKSLVGRFPSEVRLVFKHFPLNGHLMARDAAVAVEAAGRQGKFWEMHDRVFQLQEALSQETLRNTAKAIGLDLKRFDKDREDPSLAGRVEASRKEGETLGIDSTPTVFVNGRKFGLRRTLENFESRIAMERVRNKGTCR